MIRIKPLRRMGPKEFMLRVLRSIFILVSIIVSAGLYLTQPTCSKSDSSNKTVNRQRMQDAVKKLSTDFHPRSYACQNNLNKTAEYIYNHFQTAGGSPEYQTYEAECGEYKNVRCIFGEGNGSRIVVGAHYDTFGHTPGADDNASGIAGLIELAYLIGSTPAAGEIELVAYSLEEPPFFRTKEMGSYIHAQSLTEDNVDVLGVIVLEMIGYYSDKPGSQNAPMILLKLVYPDRGNYLLVVGHTGQRKFTEQIKVGMKGATDLDIFSITAPKIVPGIDFSDHLNYWSQNMNAVMVTDTSFYRNKAYHSLNDTYDTLDYYRMEKAIISVYNAILELRASR